MGNVSFFYDYEKNKLTYIEILNGNFSIANQFTKESFW